MVGGKNQAEVHCGWMDGRKKAVLWRKCSLPGSLSFSSEGRVVYWADTGEQSAALRGGLATFVLTVCVPLQLKVWSAQSDWMGQDINSINQDQVCSSPSLTLKTSSSGPLGRKVRTEFLSAAFLSFRQQVATHAEATITIQPYSVEWSACVTGLVFTLWIWPRSGFNSYKNSMGSFTLMNCRCNQAVVQWWPPAEPAVVRDKDQPGGSQSLQHQQPVR